MAELPTDSVQRITDARRTAESELKKAISAVVKTDDVAPYLSTFTSFASALLDAEAGELLTICKDADAFQSELADKVAPRIIEGILPDCSLKRVTAKRTDEEKRLAIEHDIDTDLLWEVGPDGTRKPARAAVRDVYAQHGDWENFMPKGVRHLIRWPNNNATVRAALSQALLKRVSYWVGQFQLRSRVSGRGARNRLRPAVNVSGGNGNGPEPAFQKRASWLKERLRERAWSKHDLSRHGGPDHKTVQKILDGSSVREDVLQKVAGALSKRKGRVDLLDIPID